MKHLIIAALLLITFSLSAQSFATKANASQIIFNDSILRQEMAVLSQRMTIPLHYNSQVKSFLDLYVNRRNTQTKEMLQRFHEYQSGIEEILERNQMPSELKYLPMVESAMNPTAMERSGKIGLWQLYGDQTIRCGLTVNENNDDRLDPIKSTEAACLVLKDLFAHYEDWLLAIAAYNSSEAVVDDAIAKSNGNRDYWELCRQLPHETRGYVPAYMAISFLENHAEKYGLEEKSKNLHPTSAIQPSSKNRLTIQTQNYDLKMLPDTMEIVLTDIYHGYSLPCKGNIFSRFEFHNGHPHNGVDISLNSGDSIRATFDGVVRLVLPTDKSSGYGNLVVIRHLNGLETYYGHLKGFVVASGDTMSAGQTIGYAGSTGRSTSPHLHFETRHKGLAFDPERIFDFSSGTLRCENISLKKHYFGCHSQQGMTDEQSYDAFTKLSESYSEATYYKVKKGDTLTKIAERNKITLSQLCEWNHITNKKAIFVGQKLRVK